MCVCGRVRPPPDRTGLIKSSHLHQYKYTCGSRVLQESSDSSGPTIMPPGPTKQALRHTRGTCGPVVCLYYYRRSICSSLCLGCSSISQEPDTAAVLQFCFFSNALKPSRVSWVRRCVHDVIIPVVFLPNPRLSIFPRRSTKGRQRKDGRGQPCVCLLCVE